MICLLVCACTKRFLKYKRKQSWIKNYDNINKYSSIGDIRNNNLLVMPIQEEINLPYIPNDHFILKPFTKLELYKAIVSYKDSAPGIDHIPYKFLKLLPKNAKT